MSGIGLRKIADQAEDHKQGLTQLIGLFNGILQGMIAFATLCCLHPIQHIRSLLRACINQYFDSFSLYHQPDPVMGFNVPHTCALLSVS